MVNNSASSKAVDIGSQVTTEATPLDPIASQLGYGAGMSGITLEDPETRITLEDPEVWLKRRRGGR